MGNMREKGEGKNKVARKKREQSYKVKMKEVWRERER